jgi:hypothetical protein
MKASDEPNSDGKFPDSDFDSDFRSARFRELVPANH